MTPMPAFLLVPINANGVVIDPNISTNAKNAMSAALNYNDVYLYSHGWSTGCDGRDDALQPLLDRVHGLAC